MDVETSLRNIESLPDELVFAILVFVPAQDILNVARLVCKKWYRIINSPKFIYAHLQHSPPGLLLKCWSGTSASNLIFMEMQQGQIKISELNYKFKFSSVGSCNGLILDRNSNDDMYVVNTTTEQRYALPPISLKVVTAVMAYAPASMEYKVVLTCLREDHLPIVQSCAIMTVGVDRFWRHVDTKHLSIKPEECTNNNFVLITEGFIHWTDMEITCLLTWNVETEVFTSTPVPQGCENLPKLFLSMGSCLTLVVRCSDFEWEVWELKQEECGEWMKLFKIDMEAQKCRIQKLVGFLTPSPFTFLVPVGWLNYGEVLVMQPFSITPTLFLFYNVSTQEINFFELDCNYGFPVQEGFHRNTLVHLGEGVRGGI